MLRLYWHERSSSFRDIVCDETRTRYDNSSERHSEEARGSQSSQFRPINKAEIRFHTFLGAPHVLSRLAHPESWIAVNSSNVSVPLTRKELSQEEDRGSVQTSTGPRSFGYSEIAPATPVRPSGVAMSPTLVPLRACSPRTLVTASVSPATRRAAICLPSGRVRAASRMPTV